MKQYKIEATIPTTQYGNLRPTFEVSTKEEEAEAFDSLKAMWERFGDKPLTDKEPSGEVKTTSIKVSTFTGEEVWWDEASHIYRDKEGNILLSGSKYADMHSPTFNMAMMLPKTANAWGVSENELKGIWKMNSDISLDWGNAIHQALEVYHKFQATGKLIQDKKELEANYIMPKQPFLRKTVEDFIEKFGTNALAEVVVTDVKNKRAGTIDRLEIVDEANKVCRVGDYKTNAELDKKKLLRYQKQLSFYAHILMAHGWTVESLDLFHLDHDNGWVKTEMEVLELE